MYFRGARQLFKGTIMVFVTVLLIYRHNYREKYDESQPMSNLSQVQLGRQQKHYIFFFIVY